MKFQNLECLFVAAIRSFLDGNFSVRYRSCGITLV